MLILQILHLFYKKLLAERSEASPIKRLLPRSTFLVMRSRISFSVLVYPKRAIALNSSWFFLCDRIYLMEKGCIIKSGTYQEVVGDVDRLMISIFRNKPILVNIDSIVMSQ